MLLLTGAGLLAGCATSPEAPPDPELGRIGRPDLAEIRSRAAAHGLVSLSEVEPSILVDLRYRTADNVTGRPLYPASMPCLLSASTARKLGRAQRLLRLHGRGLLVWDAYRPPEVQQRLWKAHPHGNFVSDPSRRWSRHCYGRAVDVTLVDLRGRPVPMPSGFDDFSDRAHYIYKGDDPQVARNLRLLQTAMAQAGFGILDTEWWHFNDARPGEVFPGAPIWAHELGLPLPPG